MHEIEARLLALFAHEIAIRRACLKDKSLLSTAGLVAGHAVGVQDRLDSPRKACGWCLRAIHDRESRQSGDKNHALKCNSLVHFRHPLADNPGILRECQSPILKGTSSQLAIDHYTLRAYSTIQVR